MCIFLSIGISKKKKLDKIYLLECIYVYMRKFLFIPLKLVAHWPLDYIWPIYVYKYGDKLIISILSNEDRNEPFQSFFELVSLLSKMYLKWRHAWIQ